MRYLKHKDLETE